MKLLKYCEEYLHFEKTLKKLATGYDEISDEAQSCLDLMNSIHININEKEKKRKNK